MRKFTIAALILLASLAPCFVQPAHGSAPLTIVTSSLPPATANTPYSAPVQATGGTPPYKWSVSNASLKSGLPAGIGLKLGASPGSTALGGTTAQQGAFPFLLIVTDNAHQVVQKLLTLTVQPQQRPAFTLAVSPGSLTLPQGNQGSATATTSISGGFNSPIALSASGLPAGTSVSFSPNPIPAPGSGRSTLSISVGSSTPPGSYAIAITGTGGGLHQSTTLNLTVQARQQGSFMVSVSPLALSLQQGNQSSAKVATAISGGFNSSIALSASGLPTGASVSFNPNTIPAPGAGNSTVAISVGSTTPAGSYPIVITGTGGGVHQSTTLNLTVQAQQQGNFTLSVSPLALTLPQGNQGSARVTTAISGGFNSSIALSASGLPAGTTVNFSPNPIPAPGAGNSTTSINVGSNTPAGSYPITITGNGGGVHQSATLTLTVTAAPGSGGQPLPAPPATYIDTTWNPPTGRTWNAHSAADLQNDLNAASPGDIIVLDAGATYNGNFTLPVKTNPSGQWIYIETSAVNSLPLPGTRVSPADAVDMPKIVTPNTDAAFYIAAAANHYRLVGLEVYSVSTQGSNQSLNPPSNNFTWSLIYGPYQLGVQVPDSITIDRCYIHGSDTQDVGQGIQLNFTNGAVIDSYISDIHESTFDSQAILAFWTPGPLKIVNNYLSSGGENMMFGGAGDYYDPYVPSDIEIRRNTFENPVRWEICGAHGTVPNGIKDANGHTCTVNNQWIVKNNLEFKNARRVIATGNQMNNSWMSAQTGYSTLFTIRTSQSGNNAVVDDIAFESNVITGTDSGFAAIEQDNLCSAQYGYPNCANPGESKRVWVHNNLVLLKNNPDTYQHIGIKVDGGDPTHPGLTDYLFENNTIKMQDNSALWSAVYFSLPQPEQWGCTPPPGFAVTTNLWFLNNVFTNQPDGDCGLVGANGVAGLSAYMGIPAPLNPRFFGNVLFAPSRVYSFPPDNDATTVPFTYVNQGSGDYQLQTPDWTDTTDGKVAGIDWSALQSALNP